MNTRQFILATLLTLLCASVASAQNTVTYQGQLNNAANEGVNASYPMMFSSILTPTIMMRCGAKAMTAYRWLMGYLRLNLVVTPASPVIWVAIQPSS